MGSASTSALCSHQPTDRYSVQISTHGSIQVSIVYDLPLQYAGIDYNIFSEGAIDEIRHYTGIVAQLINKLAIHSMDYFVKNGYQIIEDRMVKKMLEGELALVLFFYSKTEGSADSGQ